MSSDIQQMIHDLFNDPKTQEALAEINRSHRARLADAAQQYTRAREDAEMSFEKAITRLYLDLKKDDHEKPTA